MVKVVPSIILEDLNVLNLCLNCGAEHDRNVNAARNIETASGIPAELGEDNSLGRHTRGWSIARRQEDRRLFAGVLGETSRIPSL